MSRRLGGLLLVAAAGGALLLGALWTAVGTEIGARWVAARLLPAQVEVSDLRGRLIGPLRAGRVRYSVPEAGLTVDVDSVALEWSPMELLTGTVAVGQLRARRLSVTSEIPLRSRGEQRTAPRPEHVLRELQRLLGRPIRLPLFLALRIERLEVGKAVLRSPDFPEPVDVGRIRVRGGLDRSGGVLDELSVDGPALALTASGRFLPDRDEGGVRLRSDIESRLAGLPPVAGRLEVDGSRRRLTARITATEPVAARLDARIRDVMGTASWTVEGSADSLPVSEWAPAGPVAGASLTLRARGSLERSPEATLDATARTTAGPTVEAEATVRWTGDSVSLDELRVRGRDRPELLEASGSLVLDGGAPRLRLRGGWHGLTWPLSGEPSIASDSGRFEVSGRRDSVEVQLTAEAQAAASGPFRADLDALVGADSIIVRDVTLRPTGAPGTVRLRGAVHAWTELPSLRGRVRWSDLTWPLRGDSAVVRSPSGYALLSGTADSASYRIGTEVVVRDHSSRLAATGRVDADAISLSSLRVDLLGGTVAGSGRVAIPDGAWSGRLRADSLALGRLPTLTGHEWLARLEEDRIFLRASGSGTRDSGGPRGSVRLDSLRGTVAGRDVTGGTRVRLGTDRVSIDSLRVAVGAARLTAAGSVGERVDLDGELTAPDLADFGRSVSGAVALRFGVRGERLDPVVVVNARGDSLVYGSGTDTLRLAELDVAGQLRPARQGLPRLELSGRGLEAGGRRLDSLSLTASGSDGESRLRLRAHGQSGRLLATAEGHPTAGGWAGTVDTLLVAAPELGSWRLREATEVRAGPDSATLRPLCLEGDRTSLCASGRWSRSDGSSWEFTADSIPLSLARPWLPPHVRLGGELSVTSHGSIDTARTVRADVRASSQHLTLGAVAGRDSLARTLDSLSVHARFDSTAASGRVDMVLADSGRLSAEGRARHAAEGWQPVEGTLSVDLRDSGLTGALVPALTATAGRLSGQLRISGLSTRPAVQGTLSLADGQADVVPSGIALRDVRLRAAEEASRVVQITGGVRSGPGSADLSGTVTFGDAGDAFPALNIRLRGDELEGQNTAALRVLVSPDLRIAGDVGGIAVTGTMRVPEARLSPRQLEAPVSASPDVFVSGREAAPRPDTAARLFPTPPVQTDVTVSLGDRVSVEAYGLSGRLTGEVRVSARPDRRPTGQGEIEIVQGRYLAFQRSLQIDRGRLVFSGGPVEDPGLDLQIARRTAGVEVGMTVGGTATSPRYTLFSTPPMSEADLLSYLLFGRPVAAVSRFEGNVLRDAVQGAGLVGGDALAGRLGTALGLEESRLVNEGEGGPSLRLGTSLSPRLSLGYSIGLFGGANVLRIGYRIGRGWVVQAESGGGAGADLMYIIER